nr:hypothetical protein [Tanacetum cinerariifolium]
VDADKPPKGDPKKKGVEEEGGTENYKIWSAAVQLALHTRNKLGIIQRCFELIGYPSGFKKRSGNSQSTGTTVNNAVPTRFGSGDGITYSLTSDQYKSLMNLLSSSSGNPVDPQVDADKPPKGDPKKKGVEEGGLGSLCLSIITHLMLCGWSLTSWSIFLSVVVIRPALKKHNDLLKLMQFLMGLDDVYTPISQILTTKPLPDVKSAFATLCFELIGYPSGFKKRSSNSQSTGTIVNNAIPTRFGSGDGITYSLTSDQYKSLMNLLSSSSGNPMDPQDSAQKSLMGTGSESYGLYIYDMGKKYVNYSIKICSLSKCLWHNRLGHPANQVIEVLKGKLDIGSFTTSDPCEVYH